MGKFVRGDSFEEGLIEQSVSLTKEEQSTTENECMEEKASE